LDLQLPGLSGLDLQKQLAEAGLDIPIVFLTGHGNIPASVQAMKAGAVEFLTKPFDQQDLFRAIQEAIERDRRTRQQHAEIRELRHRYESLTAREQEVMWKVVSGMLNKQIAAELNITEDTVKFHRGHIMPKMGADSLADLVRMAENLGIRPQVRRCVTSSLWAVSAPSSMTPLRCSSFLSFRLLSKRQRASMTPHISVVDDDISARKSLGRLIRSAGLEVSVFASAEEFLSSAHPRKAECLILDIRLPGMSGIELVHQLGARKCSVPVIFITAQDFDEGARSAAASDWTVAYLIKPFGGDELLDAVNAALKWKPNN
jgi:FixJ family two-component response regulator